MIKCVFNILFIKLTFDKYLYSNKMKKLLYFLLLITSASLFSQDVQWANKVSGVSSEFIYKKIPKQYLAKQVLGEPSVIANYGSSPCAWASQKPNEATGEWIEVEYLTPQQIKRVFINENYNQGAIHKVFTIDTENNKHLIFQNDSVKPYKKKEVFTVKIPLTSYKVKGIRVELQTSKVSGHNQIDAIGISDKDIDYQIEVNQNQTAFELNITPQNLGEGINSSTDELSPVISPDGKTLYLTRLGHKGNFNIDNQDIWYSERKNGAFENPVHMKEPINTKGNNSFLSITPDGQTALLLNEYHPNGVTKTGMSITELTDTGWAFPTPVKIDSFYNDNDYGEYFLANSKNIIVMTVERNEGIASKDLFVSFKREDNTWTKPLWMGETINSAASEISPFLAADNRTLYYSSSGFPGYGGSDIFMTKRIGDSWTEWTKPLNLGAKLNSSGFDAYYSLPAKGDEVFFVSQKEDGHGKSDIYRADLPKELRPNPSVLIQGYVLNAKDSTPISTMIYYYSLTTGKKIGEAKSKPSEGFYKIILPAGDVYGFSASKTGFIPVSQNIDLKSYTEYTELKKNLYLVPIEKNAILTLNNVYFDTDKANLRSESFVELDGLVNIIKANPNIKIEISGHTDDVGNDAYNLTLSKKRANAVTQYILDKGVEKGKINSVGFGETKPVVPNNSNENRQANRRVDFKIIEL